MENVSQALLMAGGVLIGILIITFMVVVIRSGGNMNAEYDSQIAEQELTKFNNQFEVYNKNDNTIFDVITAVNCAYDVNEDAEWNTYAGVSITLVDAFVTSSTGTATTTYNITAGHTIGKGKMSKGGTEVDIYSEIIPNNASINGTTITFGCTNITYNDNGKVKSMTFKKN